MNTTRETVEPAMRAAAEDICGDYVEIVPGVTRNLMGFFVSLRRLLQEVWIPKGRFDEIEADIEVIDSVESMISLFPI